MTTPNDAGTLGYSLSALLTRFGFRGEIQKVEQGDGFFKVHSTTGQAFVVTAAQGLSK